ncbi:MAG TPA: hypothetical protein VNN62_09685 [Methylomirabilota bacterium]|nr:hypothetical protein [Methylomirabilota bacterium]
MIRTALLLSVIGVAVLFLLNVFATPSLEPTWTVRFHAAHGLQAGDVVQEGEQRIGQVTAVESRTEKSGRTATEVQITLDPPFRDRVHERSTVLLTTPPGATRPVLKLIVFDERSPVLPPGSIIAGAESNMEVELKRQLLAAEGVVRDLSRQLEDWGRTLDRAARSEELKKLEDGVGGLMDTLRRTQEDLARVITQEIARLKRLYEKLFPPERETA